MLRSLTKKSVRFFGIKRPQLFTDKSVPDSLKPSDDLLSRHIGPNTKQMQEMFKTCGVSSIQQLMEKAVPATIRDPSPLPGDELHDKPVPESEYLKLLRESASKNKIYKSFMGCGFYGCILPSVIQRNLLENPGWYTSYTPYQGEVSQGRLESLLNFQTMVSELTGLQISNASLLDEGTSGGQAFFMAYSLHEMERKKIFIDRNVFSPTLQVIRTKAKFLDVQVVVGDYKEFNKLKMDEFSCIIVQSPDNKGVFHDFTSLFKSIDDSQSKVFKVVSSDLLALTMFKSPGSMGADIAFGSSQRFGVPMGYGGPNAGFFSTKQVFQRKLPGRIIGISKDSEGNKAYRMALQTREQHIRRQKATSNICTAQALLANIAAMYGVYHGPQGLRKIAERVNALAQLAAKTFQAYGYELEKSVAADGVEFFDTITIKNTDANKLIETFVQNKINLRKISDKEVGLSFDETTTLEDIQQISQILSKATKKPKVELSKISNNFSISSVKKQFSRGVDYMKQSVFNSIHSETQMMRYLANLQAKDLSLTKSMISLGSCTMKLNAASEMIPLTWPEFNLHPFVPKDQAQGYAEIIGRLSEWLKSVTKFDAISFQPNSGAAGEYAGLLTINHYLRSKGENNRRICLIPKTAHGTNPASAFIAGMKVIPIEVNDGRIDISDLKKKAQKHQKELGAIMITFPSTAGVYEETVGQACQIIHHYGGQVYMDGANMNAQVGWTSPGFLGADVCHMNLHKTFAIPHGGGGPGAGPIGVRKHLIPHLPSHVYYDHTDKSLGSVSSAPFGSASILTISYGYIAMLGRTGLRQATAAAVLNANYIMKRLKPHYDILHVGDGYCGHEFIIDIRPIKSKTGVSEQDIAKRLIDYGFHAPTMSFPTPGTLMVEPTESEDKGQLDRFADALINIRKQIDTKPQLVKNSPYTASALLKTDWKHKFSREEAAYPLQWVKTRGKYWPTVSRIDNPYGDKNLICACPEIDAYFDK